MRQTLRIIGLIACICTLVLKIVVFIDEVDVEVAMSLLSFMVGIFLWNMLPLGLLAFLIARSKDDSKKLYALVCGAIAAAAVAIDGTGCVAMWWCEVDAQLAIVWLVLPGMEIVVGGGLILGVLLLQYLWTKITRGQSESRSEQ